MNEAESKVMSTPAAHAWKRVGCRPHHGIALPLFSLHSQKSSGIGEYLDLIFLIDWCQKIGMDVIQLLPLNDMGLDTSPYNAISAFALNPAFLSLHALPFVELVNNAQTKIAKIGYWTKTDRVKHHIVRELKNIFFKEYVPTVLPNFIASPEYRQFLMNNRHWLEPYSLFKTLKEKNFWKKWEEWPEAHRNPSPAQYQELLNSLRDSLVFHQTLQFLCYQQLQHVKLEAEKKGIFLKGDLPILISRDSADVWHHRDLFRLNFSAGSPPDMYATEGQNWGFPLYNWLLQEKEVDQWWKARIQFAANFFHLYRIDHVVGFFRIWAIPEGKSATEGKFMPEQAHQWLPAGERTLREMLNASEMLPIGEDLGAVPLEVRASLASLGICGTKVMRWERNYETDGSFIPPSHYYFLSMTTTSTHDSDPLQLWWKHSPKEARQYSEFKGWDYRPFLSADRHKSILEESHHSGSLFHINLLQEYLALFPKYVSIHASDERINIPGKVLDTNWTYRFKPSLETLQTDEKLIQTIRNIVKGEPNG